jgi:hypothetical protein
LPAQTYSSFTGQVAIVTGELVRGTSVVVVDLKNENAGVAVDKNWNSSSSPPTQLYRHPDWTTAKIGSVFGLTLDDQGNVYVTASTSYLSDVLPGNGGEVYRIDGTNGTVSKFAVLPNKGPALGNIEFSCKYQSFYVTNFADGRIYQMVVDNTTNPPTGKVVSTFAHSTGAILTGFTSKNGDPEPGRDYSKFIPKNPTGTSPNWGRPWGVKVYADVLYYSVWRQDFGQHIGNDNYPNEIWSVKLAPGGGFVAGSKHLEIKLPTLLSTNPTVQSKPYSNPVSSISFSPAGDMLLAERSMNGDQNSPIAGHESRALEYMWSSSLSSWVLPAPNKLGIGAPHPHNNPSGNRIEGDRPSSAGGGVYDLMGSRYWFTGDALHYMGVGPNAGGFPYPPDVGPPQTDYIYGIQGLPISGGTIHNSLLIDLTDNTASTGNKNEMGDIEIPCPQCGPASTPTPTPTATPAGDCCDKLSAMPYQQPNLQLDYRTFTITNLKAPVSPICYVDISFSPAPNPIWQGGDLYLDGVYQAPGTKFGSPYIRIPNKPLSTSTISAVNTVKFNLGVDFTINWSGSVTFVVHHCDGTTCTLTYGPWIALLPPKVPGPQVFDAAVTQEGKLYNFNLHLKNRERKRQIKWIGFRVEDENGQLFATTPPPPTAREADRVGANVENGGLGKTSILYSFGQPLQSGQSADGFNLVVARDAKETGAPVLAWTIYDADGNAIETGTIGAAPRK